METFFRSFVAVFFIGLIVIGIVLFSIFIIVPTDKLVNSRRNATSTGGTNNVQVSPFNYILNSFIPGLVPKQSAETENTQNNEISASINIVPQNQTATEIQPPIIQQPPAPAPPSRPYQSAPIQKEEVPSTAIKLVVSSEGFFPSVFMVKAKQKVTLAVTSGDTQTHIFKFEDESLSDVAVGLGPKETRTIEFFAPKKAAEYLFYCDVPGHKGRGEIGKMIVE